MKERAREVSMGLDEKKTQWSASETAAAMVVVEVGPVSVIMCVRESLGRLEDHVASQRCRCGPDAREEHAEGAHQGQPEHHQYAYWSAPSGGRARR